MSNHELCSPQTFPEAVQPKGPEEEEVLCTEVMPVLCRQTVQGLQSARWMAS